MRRTKEWWSVLNKSERVWLVYAEGKSANISLTRDYYCTICDRHIGIAKLLISSRGFYHRCYSEWRRITCKAERMIIRLKAVQLMDVIAAMGIQPPIRKEAVKVVRRLMCRWDYDSNKWRGIVNTDISITYHPLKPASELLVTGWQWDNLPYTRRDKEHE